MKSGHDEKGRPSCPEQTEKNPVIAKEWEKEAQWSDEMKNAVEERKLQEVKTVEKNIVKERKERLGLKG